MNDKNFIEIDRLFEDSAVEMPSHLRRKLLEIPGRYPGFDWGFILPIVFLLPLCVWLILSNTHLLAAMLLKTSEYLLSSGSAVPLAIAILGPVTVGAMILLIHYSLRDLYHFPPRSRL